MHGFGARDLFNLLDRPRVDLLEEIMTREVIIATPEEAIDIAARRLDQNRVSALPVVDNEKHVIGIITSDDISKLLARRC